MVTTTMSPPVRKNRSFSLDADVLDQVERTKGSSSTSERVNQLLKYALAMEHRARVDREIMDFFADASEDRKERRAFQTAAFKSLAREE